jgi:glycosyltransferase
VKISIITAVYNNIDTIEQCINSVYAQAYNNIEHIIIDGVSSDGTLEVIKSMHNKFSRLVSEPDRGIYHALNKGIKLASGDSIGFLHADDFYADNRVIEKVVSHMERYNVDSCYGDLLYVGRKNTGRIVRYWKSCTYTEGLFQRGWMPPHPTFFVKKKVYDKLGCFNTGFKIAADYELMLRFLERSKVPTHYIPEVLVKMRTGGSSNRNIKNIAIKTYEDITAWKVNNLNGGIYTILRKNFSKIPQFFIR